MGRKAGKYKKKEDDDLLKKKSVPFDSDNEDIDASHTKRDVVPLNINEEDVEESDGWTHAETDEDEEDEDVDDDKPPKGLAAISVSKKRSRRQCQTYYDMTDDELVKLCRRRDRPNARRVVHDLRKYLIQVSESEGFDIKDYPGYYPGVTDLVPAKYSARCYFVNEDPESLAKSVIDHYNLHNKKTKYEVECVDQMNVYTELNWIYYVTFRARDVKKSNGHNQMEMATPLTTFQAIVEIQGLEIFGKGQIEDIHLCRLKPN